MKLHYEEIKIKVLVPDGYHIADITTDQAVIPRIENELGCFDIIHDILTSRVSIRKDSES